MKRPSATVPRRAISTAGAVARNRKEAAIQLVRLEFDMSRVEMAIAQADQRANTHRAELAEMQRRRTALLALLDN